MKALLMHRDADFNPHLRLPPNQDELLQDLELATLLRAMARGDPLILEMARAALLASLPDPDAIRFRQQVLADCLEHPAIVRELYQIAADAIQGERSVYLGIFRDSPGLTLHRSLDVLQLFVRALKRLRAVGDEHADEFRSEGFTRLFAMLAQELNDEYFRVVEDYLAELKLRGGVLISAELGQGNKGANYVLRRPRERQGWWNRIPFLNGSDYSFRLPERDESGARALTELRDRGINAVANALAQSTDHILSFFKMLQAELAFYIGCVNLHETLTEKGEPTCIPEPVSTEDLAFSANGLYDACLSLSVDGPVVGNDLDADGKRLVMITGANQGGKSTFLRSAGLAQLMMQCGMFVPAASFRGSVCSGLFTHYKREEDAAMQSGKLDEELARMSTIADAIRPGGLLLCNESFASTNEREGSEIARQVVRALTESGVRVFFVTHLFDLAQSLYRSEGGAALFLRADRQSDGSRTFKLVEGEPLPTSYGEDSYRRIFRLPLDAVGTSLPTGKT